MFTKTKGADTPQTPSAPNPTQEAIRSASSKPAARAAASIICSDMKIVGSVASEGALQIDGKVEGDVTAQDIVIGASGVITGEVKAEVVTVKGTIKGSIRARKVELETGAKVEGDIIHTSLSIQANAVFEGQVKHATDPLKDAGPKPAAASQQPTGVAPQPAAKPAPANPGPNANPAGQPGNA
jgi:cytoskeletal protein CcmA (bactofilin family)